MPVLQPLAAKVVPNWRAGSVISSIVRLVGAMLANSSLRSSDTLAFPPEAEPRLLAAQCLRNYSDARIGYDRSGYSGTSPY